MGRIDHLPHPRAAKMGQTAHRPAQRPTIGFLVGNLHLGAGRILWPGVLDAARVHDANLISFPGGPIDSGKGAAGPRSAAYDLAAVGRCDGLVTWSSTMGGALSDEEVAAFHRRYLPLPMVSLSQLLPGVPVVAIDSYNGMRGAVEHLIGVHGCRRLAFIRGPESHFYAQERYQAYLDVLREAGIKFDPALVSAPAPWDSGAAPLAQLLDERGLRPGRDFEAVVAVSDLLAIAALDGFARRGIRVPHDVALVGFNDQPEGRYTTPPLTSVALPLYEQGYAAVELLLRQLTGRPPAGGSRLACCLHVRQSCGCPSQSVALAAARPGNAWSEGARAAGRDGRDTLRAALAAEIGLPDGEAPRLDALVEALRDDAREGGSARFLRVLDDLLRAAAARGHDPSRWQNAISRLRALVLPITEPAGQGEVESLCSQARVVVAETAQRLQAQRYLAAQRRSEVLAELGQRTLNAFDVDRLSDVLAERLPAAGIRSAYLALYREPPDPGRGAQLALAFTERGRADLGPDGRNLPAGEFVPAELFPWWRRYSLVLEPLFVGDESLGFALFEVGPDDGALYDGVLYDGAAYEVLRGQVSSAVKGALLFNEAQGARLAAEKADRMKTRLLANVTHELRAPLNIILNQARAALDSPEPPGPAALQADLQHIRHSAEHQLRVINDLLDLSRAEIDQLELYPETLDPCAFLRETFEDMTAQPARAGGVAWRLDIPDGLPPLQADPVRLRQVLLNLLGNAARFTRSGEIVLGADAAPPHLHIWVKDSGMGIPADQQERIFEPFVTGERAGEEAAGIGLGLAISRHLIALHGGTITVDSQAAAGSTFHVRLPLPPDGQEPDGAAPGMNAFLVKPSPGDALLAAVGAARREEEEKLILIVDDEEATRESYRQILDAGLPDYALLTAGDGREALAALAALAPRVPSLVLLDLVMPGMDGFEVLDHLRGDPATRRVPVVILSSRSLTQDDVRRLQAHALVTFQSKGVLSEDEMAAMVQRALTGSDRLQPQTSAVVKAAISYLQRNYARPVARWEVADAAGASEDYLTYIFRRELGLTPWDYLNRYRIEQARRLLRETNDSIGRIAARVGLKDQAYFSRLFRKLTGVSPNEYRQQSQRYCPSPERQNPTRGR